MLNYKIEDVMDTLQEDLCEYCPLQDKLDEVPPPITQFSQGCEGRYCGDAAERYLKQRKKKVRRLE